MPKMNVGQLSRPVEGMTGEISARRLERMAEVLATRLQTVTVVGEAIRRRHNVSAILRSAEAFGVHHVHLVTNDFSPAPGAARGTERWLEIHRHDTTEACLEALKADGFRVYVCDLDEGALAPEAVPVDQPIALVFGSELQGVTPAARALADGVVSVPMRGFAESLNVSVAAALTLRPVCERRRAIVGEGDLTPEQQIALFCGWVERDVQAKANARKRHGL